jgi:glyoxylase-like metal-dependent hydrolase (beta-lactamase superfamily II)
MLHGAACEAHRPAPRHRWRGSLIALAWAALAASCSHGAASPPSGAAVTPAVAAPANTGRAIEVASGVYMVQGVAGEIDPGNLGRVGNAGFIVGPRGVLVIDSGSSAEQGEALLGEIARVTDQPVRLLLLTQTRQEFLFGAMPFQRRGIPIHMHRAAATLMASRCDGCLKTLKRVLGDEAMAGSAVPHADVLFDADLQLDAQIGRPLRVLHFGLSSGPGHVAVLDGPSGVLFAGGLVDVGRIPDVQDAHLPGWRTALQRLDALVAGGVIRRVVPGHGPAAPPASIDVVRRYLDALDHRTRELLEAGAALSEVGDACEIADFAAWDQYDTIHRRNASVMFLRHERELLLK